LKFCCGDVGGRFVGVEGVVGGFLSAVTGGELSKVSVIISLHLVVEDLRLASLGGWDEVLVQNIEDIAADL